VKEEKDSAPYECRKKPDAVEDIEDSSPQMSGGEGTPVIHRDEGIVKMVIIIGPDRYEEKSETPSTESTRGKRFLSFSVNSRANHRKNPPRKERPRYSTRNHRKNQATSPLIISKAYPEAYIPEAKSKNPRG
jgi:hypothetical protein